MRPTNLIRLAAIESAPISPVACRPGCLKEVPLVRIMVATLVAAMSLPIAAAGTAKKKVPSYKAESSAYVLKRKDAWTFVTKNRSFRFVDVLGNDGSNYEAQLMLEESYHNERTDGLEGAQGRASVRAWTLVRGRRRGLRWTFQEIGNEGVVQDRLFRIAAWGCCDVPVVYSYYNLLTGRKLYVSNSDLLEVRGEGGGPQAVRLVAFGYSGMGRLERPPELQYGTDMNIKQRFSVVSSRQYYDAPETFVSTNEELQKSLELRELTFVIVMRYGDGVELRIPVEADTLRADRAVLPEGYSLHAEK